MNLMMTVVYGGTALFAWSGVIFRARDLIRDPTNRPLRALLHMALALGLALIMIVIGPVMDSRPELAGLASSIWHILTLWAATQFSAWVLYSSHPDKRARIRMRSRLAVFFTAATTIALAWLAAGTQTREYGFRVIDTSWAAAAWQAAFVLALGWSMLDGSWLSVRYSRYTRLPDLRISLRLLATGACCGLVFCLAKVFTASAQITNVGPIVPGIVLVLCVAASAFCVWAGVLYPGVAARLRAVPRWLHRRRLHRDLWPLWNELRCEFSQQTLGRVPSRGLIDAVQLRFLATRLYRRVIEIRDMLLLLRPWYCEHAREEAERIAETENFPTEQRAALIDGALVAAALRAKQNGIPPGGNEIAVGASSPASLPDEAHWLREVERARRHLLLQDVPTQCGQHAPR